MTAGPHYNHTIKQVHVHHTVSSNRYRRRDVPGADPRDVPLPHASPRLVRHRLQLPRRPVRADLDRSRGRGAPSGARRAHARLQLHLGRSRGDRQLRARPPFRRRARRGGRRRRLEAPAATAATRWATSGSGRTGSDRFRAGRKVRLPTIDGHRDTNQTACPGRHLYHHLDEIRHRAAVLIRATRRCGWPSRRAARHPGTRQHAHGRPGHLQPRRRRPLLRLAARRPAASRARRVASTTCGRPTSAPASPSASPPASPASSPSPAGVGRSGPTTGPATVSVGAHADGGRLRVAVRVTSPRGVRPVPPGKVVVKVDGRRAVVRLADGRGVATFGAKRPLAARAPLGEGQVPGRPLPRSRPRLDPSPHPSLSWGQETWTKRSSLPRWPPWHSCASCSTRWPA